MTTTNVATPLDIGAIEERVNATTPGPWAPRRAVVGRASEHGDVAILTPDNPATANTLGMVGEVWAERVRGVFDATQAMRDADFICAAREDVPALVAEVARLRVAAYRLAAFGFRSARYETDRDFESAVDAVLRLVPVPETRAPPAA